MTEDADDTAGVTTELVAIPVSDEITLDGVLWTPPGGPSETAIALFHGTGGAFHYPLLTWLGPRLAAMGYPTLSLNRRDHGQYFGYYTLHDASMDHAHAVDLLCARCATRPIPSRPPRRRRATCWRPPTPGSIMCCSTTCGTGKRMQTPTASPAARPSCWR